MRVGGVPGYVYQALTDAIRRCHDPKHWHYPTYSSRGITVCAAWRESVHAFYAHIGERPGKGYSLDRIDNARGYEPGNVRWATREQQQNNKSTSRMLTFEGRTMSISQWAREIGTSRQRLHYLIAYAGMSGEEAIASILAPPPPPASKPERQRPLRVLVSESEYRRVVSTAERFGITAEDLVRLVLRDLDAA